jgi:hypothetical protein
MPSRFKPPAVWRGALLLALMLLIGVSHADTVEEDNIKAGFVLNFAKYTEWPAAALGGGELRVCALGAQPLAGKLGQLQGRQVQGREIAVRVPAKQEDWRECHVLFVPASEAARVDALLRTLGQAAVLTIGDGNDFVEAGGMIGMKQRGGRIRFDVNLAAARRAGLNLSSQMLKLADEVRQ